MAISYVGEALFDGASSSVTTITLDTSTMLTAGGSPVTPQVGDLLVAVVSGVVNSNPGAQAGWTTISAASSTALYQGVYYRFMQAGDTSFDFSVASARASGVLRAYRGVDAFDPLDSISADTQTGTSALTVPQMFPLTPGSLVVGVASLNVSFSVNSVSWTSSNLDQIGPGAISGGSSNGSDAITAIGHEAWTSGAFTPVMTDNVTSARSRGTSFVLRPGATATAVGAQQATAYDITVAVAATRATAFDDAASVSATRATAYDTATAVGAQRASAYDVAATVTASAATAYDITQAVTATRAASWDVSATVAAERATAYDVAGVDVAVGAEMPTAYDVAATVSTSRPTAWDDLTPAGADQDTEWTDAATVAGQQPTTYDITTAVALEQAIAYDADGAVSAEVETTWDVAGAPGVVGAEAETAWDAAATVTSERPTEWTIADLVALEQATAFDQLAAVGADRDVAFNIAALGPGEIPVYDLQVVTKPGAVGVVQKSPVVEGVPTVTPGIAVTLRPYSISVKERS